LTGLCISLKGAVLSDGNTVVNWYNLF